MEKNEKLELIRAMYHKWQQGDLRFKMHEGQLQIHSVLRALDPSVRIRMMECCRGYGKTTLNVLMACEDCARPHPLNYPVRIIGPEKDQTVKIVSQIFDVISQDAPAGWIRNQGSIWYVGRNRIEVDGFNRGSIERLRGKRAMSIYLEEIRDVPSESLEYGLKSILLPMALLAKCPVVAATTSSRQKLHSMNTYFREVAKENDGYFTFSIYQCPLYNESDIKQAIKDCGGVESEDFKTEYLCETVDTKVQRAVPQYDESMHTVDYSQSDVDRVWIVIDVGGLRDPTFALVFCYQQARDRVVVLDERMIPPQTPTSSMVQVFRELQEIYGIDDEDDEKPVYMDAPGQFMVDLQEDHLFRCRGVNKGRFQESLKAVNQAFYDNQLVLCRNLAQLNHQLITGKLNKSHEDFERDPPVGEFLGHHCDGIAALMYGWRMRDVTRRRESLEVDYDRQWVNPRVRLGEQSALTAITPRMKRFK